jgi:hypothetical protein
MSSRLKSRKSPIRYGVAGLIAFATIASALLYPSTLDCPECPPYVLPCHCSENLHLDVRILILVVGLLVASVIALGNWIWRERSEYR